MGLGWKDIVPSDNYRIVMARRIHPMELGYLTHLYQPLIGPLSVCFYMTLYYEASIDFKEVPVGNHRGLMSMLGTSLDKIVKARECLEAVGLLRTIKVEEEQGDSFFEYILQPPMEPSSFFRDDMMSIILLNRVGKARYRYMREKWIGAPGPSTESGNRKELTKSFDEVFQSISPSELVVSASSETGQFLTEMERTFPLRPERPTAKADIQFSRTEPDFVFLEASLPKSLSKSRKINPALRNVVREIAFFYQLDDLQISYFLQDPFIYNDDNEISIDLLRTLVKEWYSRQYEVESPKLKPVEPPKDQHENNDDKGEKLSQEEAHRQALSKLSPIALLERYQGGSMVSPADLKIVDELSRNYNLTPGVINVLLEYVMLTNNKQLPRALIFKIATHWKRLRIETVDEALEQAKQLHQETRQNNKTTKTNPSSQKRENTAGRKNNINQNQRKDVLPEWVINQPSAAQHENQELDEEKKKQAMELLRALGEID